MRTKFLHFLILIFASASIHAQNAAPFWSIAGNSNATSSSKLGTTNYTALNLATNNVPRIYVAPNGFVGIGTSSPKSQLHVEGQTLLNIFVNTVVPGLQSGSGLIAYVKGQPTAAGQRLGYFLAGSQGGGTNPYNATGMVGYADGAWTDASRPAYIAFETTKTGTKARSEAMRIASTGYVGIGTTNPIYRFHSVDSQVAVYAQGVGNGSFGLYATGGYYGVYGTGIIGAYASGTSYGVQGYGSTAGVYGNASSSGVSGYGGTYGIYGSSNSYGVYGNSINRGVQGNGFIGVFGQATGDGYGGWFNSNAGYALVTKSTGTYAAYFGGACLSTSTYQTSDRDLKKNITEFADALSIIKRLKPRSYEFRKDGKLTEMNLPKGRHYGLIAQDLETVLPNLVKESQDMILPPDDTAAKKVSVPVPGMKFKAVNYIELIPIIVKGIQEQDEKDRARDSENTALKQRVQTLESEMQEVRALLLSNNPNGSHSAASLEVPVPNPAKGNTNIRYAVPVGTASARLTIVNMLGQVMKEVKLSGGTGNLNMDVSGLASGTYPCTLWVNGQPAVSKQLVVVR